MRSDQKVAGLNEKNNAPARKVSDTVACIKKKYIETCELWG